MIQMEEGENKAVEEWVDHQSSPFDIYHLQKDTVHQEQYVHVHYRVYNNDIALQINEVCSFNRFLLCIR